MVENLHRTGWWPQVLEPLRQAGGKIAEWFAPASEASAAEDSYEIKIELPGVKLEDIHVTAEGNHLTVTGEKTFEREESGKSYFFSEREYGAFKRTFRLPEDADQSEVSAEYRDGVLSLKIPKAGPPPDKAKRIPVRAR